MKPNHHLILAGFALVFAFISAAQTLNAANKAPHILFMIGEREYRTHESLPRFAKEELAPLGFKTTFVHADEDDPNHFTGLEALKDADLLFVSVRRRTPSEAQMRLIREHLAAGKGLIGIRTASHAFALRNGEPPDGRVAWQEFDSEVLGHHYEGHYNNREGTEIAPATKANPDPLLKGVDDPVFHSGGTLYRARDIAPNATVLLIGKTIVDGETQTEPVALYRTYKESRVFYTSLGHVDDFKAPAFRKLLVNAVHWALRVQDPGEGH